MSSSTLATLATTEIGVFWSYLTSILAPLVEFAIVASFVGVLVWFIIKKVRHIV